MKLGRWMAGGLAGLLLALGCLLSGCGQQSSTEKPDLSALGEIHVIAREDGSGTRTQFESLIGTTESGTKQIASSTEETIQAVAADPSAIGYVALSALPDDADVKILSVNGKAPSEKTIQNRKYPLTRKYYLAWQGKTSDLSDLEREFITYVRGAGQKFVAQEAIPVAKETSFLSMKPSGTLKIAGSTSMTPLLKELADDYTKNYNANANIEIDESDSTQGLIDAIQGRADLAMSSRDLKDYESELLSSQPIAADGIVLIVNPENDLENLTTQELRSIYDGKVTEWSGL